MGVGSGAAKCVTRGIAEIQNGTPVTVLKPARIAGLHHCVDAKSPRQDLDGNYPPNSFELGVCVGVHRAWILARAASFPSKAVLLELTDRLVEGRLVKRVRDNADGRRVKIMLTAKAERLLESLSEAHLKELDAIRPALLRLLRQLR